ncbi:GNAT family N-acetyltransferase [Streptomyces sp. 4N509B]|uniref:GNAT family N-acetyltransferase n=1 Tax=Streptomyces sp. 4N509B TaxID=3457413 RepID=UPI003FD15DDF
MTHPEPGRAPRALSLPLRTDRLDLRLPTADDVDDVFAYQGLPEVARFLYRPPRTRERCAEIIAAGGTAPDWTADGDTLTLLVCRRGTPGVVGEVSLTLSHARARQMEIGWTLHPRHEGHGYATEAARALATAAFDVLDAHRVYARLDVENSGSARVCERLGMRREAHLVENDLTPDGRWGSEYVYAALGHELRRRPS